MGNFVQVNGIRLHYLEHAGGEPLVVLLHGLTANAHSFEGLVRAGLSPRFRVISVDLRGRGLSDKPPSGYSMAEHAADILGLLDTLGAAGPVVLGGHSFGGLLTLYIASHWPERVSRMLVLDAAGSMHPQVRELLKPSLARLGRVLPSVEASLAAARQAPYLEGQWGRELEDYFRADVAENPDGTAQSRASPQPIAEAMEGALSEPWYEHLPRARQPALLLNAPRGLGPPDAPPVVPRELALETARALPDCRYLEVPGNHYTMLFGDHAGHTVRAITDFLSS
ncbi:MAG: alpha/beta hydrolase [Myxococcaceae bacterium]|nr:alpha/beta hydrolase [Myxococcaceae bacterium]